MKAKEDGKKTKEDKKEKEEKVKGIKGDVAQNLKIISLENKVQILLKRCSFKVPIHQDMQFLKLSSSAIQGYFWLEQQSSLSGYFGSL